jgi:polyadenylate-binding protein
MATSVNTAAQTAIPNEGSSSNASGNVVPSSGMQYMMPSGMQQENQSMNNSASLYVGDLNAEVTEALLFDIFNAVGPVASIRVCRDVATRRSLGYAYVNFHNQTDAERALDTMNYTLIKGTPCRIMWSQRDPSLRKTGAGNVFCKNLDPSIDNKALYDTFSLFGDILSCKVVNGRDGASKGYGFVHFETPEAADEAIAKINGMLIAGREVYVGRFVKRTERPGATEWTNVFVKNIPVHWDKPRFEDEMSNCGPIASAVIMTDEHGQSRGFGFVDFVEHEAAVKCVATMNEKVFPTKLGEETGLEESEGEDDADDAASPPPDKEAEEYYVEKKDGTVPDSEAKEKNADGTEKKRRKPKKTTTLFVARAQKKVERERDLAQKFEQLKNERLNRFAGINCFVKNLHEDVDDELLRKEFAPFGVITSARVMRDAHGEPKAQGSPSQGPVDPSAEAPAPAADGSQQGEQKEGAPKSNLHPSKGFGFVCFSAPEEATRAVTEMNGKMILGKPIYVALAQRKDARRAQLEAQHGQRMVGGMARGMPMQAPLYGGAPMYYGGMPGPVGAMGGRGALGNFAYLQQPMMQGGMGGPGMGPRGMGMGPGMPRGAMGGPMSQFRAPGNFQMGPNSVMYGGQPPMGMVGGPQNAAAVAAGRARRSGRQGTRQPRVPGAPMGVPGLPMMMPGQKYMGQPGMPQQGQPGQQQGGQVEPLTAAALANASEEQRKNIIGERLFPLIYLVQPQLAGKITGMLLEMDNPELLHLIESPDALNDKIMEALHVLEAHQQTDATE